MRFFLPLALLFFLAATTQAQLRVELKFKRMQFIAYEPVVAMVKITNLAGRDVDLREQDGRSWFGFEINAGEGRPLSPMKSSTSEPALHLGAGQTVIRKIDLTPLFPVHDLGVYHVRANVFLGESNRFFYSPARVFQIASARSIWQETVGIPDGIPGAGSARTYSLLSSRSPAHTSLYVRVENKDNGMVHATYSLGRIIAVDEPQAKLDRTNHLHVLHCTAPRKWAYSLIGLNGELLGQSVFMETKRRPRLRQGTDGAITVSGGLLDLPGTRSARSNGVRMSTPSANLPTND